MKQVHSLSGLPIAPKMTWEQKEESTKTVQWRRVREILSSDYSIRGKKDGKCRN
jgi:hypothetical protein